MGTAACWNCDYALEGLAPGADGVVICPECSLPQDARAGAAARSRGGYFVGFLTSVGVQAACLPSARYLWGLHGREGSLLHQFASALAIFAPVIGAVAGVAAIALARRGQKTALRFWQWRLWGLLLLALLVNAVLWLVIFVIVGIVFDKGTLLGY